MTALAVITQQGPLTLVEVETKAALVATVDRTIGNFVECGDALTKIRDGGLFRDEASTFTEFVELRWSISDRRARQLMASAEIVHALPAGTAVPLSERQVRELMPLRDQPDLTAEAIRIASEAPDGLTTASLKAAVKSLKKPLESWEKQMVPAPHWPLGTSVWLEMMPMISESQMASMVASIKRHGLREPGWLSPEGLLLDGRIRLVACQRAGVKMRWRIYDNVEADEGLPTGYFINMMANIQRQNLNEGQLAFAAVKFEKLLDEALAGVHGEKSKAEAERYRDRGDE